MNARRSLVPVLRAVATAAGLAVASLGGGCASDRGGGARERDVGSPVEHVADAVAGDIGRPTGGPGPRGGAGSEAEAPRTARRAIVIGISRYKDGALPPLELASADAEAVYGFLVDEWGGDFPRANVRQLLDEEATLERNQAEVLEANRRTSAGDTLVIYFAGHGAVDVGSDGRLRGNLLVPHDAVAVVEGGTTRIDPKTGLSIGRLQELLQVNSSRILLLVLDACFSGGAGGRTLSRVALDPRQAGASEDELQGLADVRGGRAVLTATAPNQPALEVPRLRHGLFTHYLLRAFDNDADLNGTVTLDEVYAFVSERVRDEARKLSPPREQTPTLKQNLTRAVPLRALPRTRFKVGLEVRYDGRPEPVESAAAPQAAPAPVPQASRYRAEVAVREAKAPLHVHRVRFVRGPRGTSSERLIPFAENAFAPRVSVVVGRAARFPVEAETGSPFEPVREGEREALVVFVLVASQGPVDLELLDRVEMRARLAVAADAGGPEGLARRVANAFEEEPELKHVALRYAFIQHGHGSGDRPGTRGGSR